MSPYPPNKESSLAPTLSYITVILPTKTCDQRALFPFFSRKKQRPNTDLAIVIDEQYRFFTSTSRYLQPSTSAILAVASISSLFVQISIITNFSPLFLQNKESPRSREPPYFTPPRPAAAVTRARASASTPNRRTSSIPITRRASAMPERVSHPDLPHTRRLRLVPDDDDIPHQIARDERAKLAFRAHAVARPSMQSSFPSVRCIVLSTVSFLLSFASPSYHFPRSYREFHPHVRSPTTPTRLSHFFARCSARSLRAPTNVRRACDAPSSAPISYI